MPRFVADPLPPGCPWSDWTPPNVDWCEAERCALVVNPADTWSNLAYIALGIWMIVAARGSEGRAGSLLSLFGPASIVVGVFSLVYHASYTWFFQFFDFVGMFVFCFAVITANALRLGWIRDSSRWTFYATGVVVTSAAVPAVAETPVPIQAMVAVLIGVILGQELALRMRRDPGQPAPPYPAFFGALALIAAAAGFSLVDVTRTWCDPESWLQGHALWHVLSAASLLALFYFYRHMPAPD
jgi:hypothetical protein